ncbi:hypothetical protein AGRA3207_004057 [Actinomadura graeca]|uniref:Uncharacterized protein n=1 Tax=Actinomadura graeca TaxID=2750812 RepID=A0ABX8QVW6_9ACTN|nr:hypothetical protein [Actinomadura graeca]QXJ22971.1 hypothetical protein AGRA3207_004057 [Actinomadura graeca]
MPLSSPRAARRRRHREAVLGGSPRAGLPERDGPPLDVVTGMILDASPHLLVLRTAGPGGGEVRLPMTETTTVWYGGRGGLAALRPGRGAIVRPREDGLGADRVWVDIGRVTGTILACGRNTVEVDMGPHRGNAHVVVPPHALGRVLVRHPRLEPGYLIDVICVRSADGPRAVRPGTSQPGYRADDLGGPEASAPVPDAPHGTATWFGFVGTGLTAPRGGYDEGAWSHAGQRGSGVGQEALARPQDGVAYPAVDSEGNAGGCVDAPSGCVALPYLSLGSEVTVHNECSGRAATLPVVECGCAAARYCDRCVECGTSPRGRIVELTPQAFAGLGGDLEAGCFNAVVRPGVPAAGTAGAGRGRAGRW